MNNISTTSLSTNPLNTMAKIRSKHPTCAGKDEIQLTFCSPKNPRAWGRDGEGPIYIEHAPFLAPLVDLDPFC